MSRVAKEILDCSGVKINYDSTTMIVSVSGKHGSESIRLFTGMNFNHDVEKNQVWITLNEEIETVDRKIEYADRAKWGLVVRLLKNAIHGVKNLFVESLQFVGIGYKGQVVGDTIVMKLGYSHDVVMKIPEGLTVKMETPTMMQISGVNKQKIGAFMSIVSRKRKYNPYKGKGVINPKVPMRIKEIKGGKK
jgi:large subunit ribosomal protein L6